MILDAPCYKSTAAFTLLSAITQTSSQNGPRALESHPVINMS